MKSRHHGNALVRQVGIEVEAMEMNQVHRLRMDRSRYNSSMFLLCPDPIFSRNLVCSVLQ